MPVLITNVEKNSIAQKYNICQFEKLVCLNGNAIHDVLDYRFYETSNKIDVEIESVDGKRRTIAIEKGQYQSLGLEFETYLMDKQQRCNNSCIFCFIDQMPKGLRESLYFKDDDSRLSFLFGNYITLTNLKDHDVDRIINMHISPINISVHTTNPTLRNTMMGNRFAGDSLRHLYKLAQSGTKINCQLVLCPNINDGDELKRTLSDLKKLAPNVESIACVPVGVTSFREGLYPLTTYTKEKAQEVIDILDDFAKECENDLGSRLAYPSDEFYLTAEKEIPDVSFYGDFNQLENGVGMISLLKDDFNAGLEDIGNFDKKLNFSLATGVLAYPTWSELINKLQAKCKMIKGNVYQIENNFFGKTITVAGLVTGGDLIEQLKGKELGEFLLIPSVMLRNEGDKFLDDVTLEEASNKLGTTIIPVDNDGYAIVDMLIDKATF